MERKSIFLILAVLITASVLFAGCATQSPPGNANPGSNGDN